MTWLLLFAVTTLQPNATLKKKTCKWYKNDGISINSLLCRRAALKRSHMGVTTAIRKKNTHNTKQQKAGCQVKQTKMKSKQLTVGLSHLVIVRKECEGRL